MAVAREPAFAVDVDQNEYLPTGARDVSALVTVTAGRTLSSIQRADLFGDRVDEGGQRLIAAILRILKRPPDAVMSGID